SSSCCFSSRRRHTRFSRDWSSDVCSSDLLGIVPAELEHLIVPEMRLRLRGNGLEKKDLAMLDVLATADWERPLYVNNTSLAQFKIGRASCRDSEVTSGWGVTSQWNVDQPG